MTLIQITRKKIKCQEIHQNETKTWIEKRNTCNTDTKRWWWWWWWWWRGETNPRLIMAKSRDARITLPTASIVTILTFGSFHFITGLITELIRVKLSTRQVETGRFVASCEEKRIDSSQSLFNHRSGTVTQPTLGIYYHDFTCNLLNLVIKCGTRWFSVMEQLRQPAMTSAASEREKKNRAITTEIKISNANTRYNP